MKYLVCYDDGRGMASQITEDLKDLSKLLKDFTPHGTAMFKRIANEKKSGVVFQYESRSIFITTVESVIAFEEEKTTRLVQREL